MKRDVADGGAGVSLGACRRHADGIGKIKIKPADGVVPGPAVGGINVGSGESAVKNQNGENGRDDDNRFFPVNEFHFFLKYSTNANEERLFASVRHYPPERNTLKSIRVIYRNVVKGRSVGGIGSGEVGAVLDVAFRAESGKRAAARDARLPACPGTVRNGGIPARTSAVKEVPKGVAAVCSLTS